MASIYARGNVLWIKFKNKHGRPERRSSGYRVGQEALARELAEETERQSRQEHDGTQPALHPSPESSVACVPPIPGPGPASPTQSVSLIERIGPTAPTGALTVAAYIEEWIKRRVGIATLKDDLARLHLHVIPLIGHMAIAEVRPKHIRDLVNALKHKTSDALKCKGEPLAPRTVRRIYGTVRVLFKSAVIDEHIAASPVLLEANVLPMDIDKDPEWRSTAIFEREELIALISDERIPNDRRVQYALEGISGMRHGEAAALRVRSYNPHREPLGCLTVARSGTKKRTKTQLTREIPVHPTLAVILDDWLARGWAEKYGRMPTPDDLIIPTQAQTVRTADNSRRALHNDLENLGLRARRGHDLRRTFITLARADGGRADVLRPLTHPGERDIIGLYSTFPWPVICAELAKLQLPLPSSSPLAERLAAVAPPVLKLVPPPQPEVPERPAELPLAKIAAQNPGHSPGHIPGHSPECAPKNDNDFGDPSRARTCDLRFRKASL